MRMSTVKSNDEVKVEESIVDPSTTDSPTSYDTRPHIVHLTMYGVFLASFLVALDRTILGTAIPKITNELNSLSDVGWYGSAYLLTSCSCQLFLGRVYTFYNPKFVFLSLLFIFELGSVLCGIAPNSITLIVGRAVAGAGSAGIFSGAIVIIVRVMPSERRPLWMGCFGAIFGIANILGPVLGGLFTTTIGWRWCFYINLPIGAVAACLLFFLLRIPNSATKGPASFKDKVVALDPIGTLIFLPSIIFLLLALQLGGTSYAWSSVRVLPFLVLSPILLILFATSQYLNKKHATLPGRIIFQRSVLACAVFSFCLGATNNVVVYFIPIYFQAVRGATAIRSGVLNLPQVVGHVLSSVSSGVATRKTGYFLPWMFFSATMMPLGCGLLTTIGVNTREVLLAIFQVLIGLGFGSGIQQSAIAVQCVLQEQDVPAGAALMFFSQSLGGAVMLSVANNIFDNRLLSGLVALQRSGAGIDARQIIIEGATDFRHFVTNSALPAVLQEYDTSLVYAFRISTGTAAAAMLGAALMQWKRANTGVRVAE